MLNNCVSACSLAGQESDVSVLGSHPLPTRHSRESVMHYIDTNRQLFFSLPYFRFCTSVFVLQHFPLAPCALQSAACHIKEYASLFDLRVPVAAKGECKAANEFH